MKKTSYALQVRPEDAWVLLLLMNVVFLFFGAFFVFVQHSRINPITPTRPYDVKQEHIIERLEQQWQQHPMHWGYGLDVARAYRDAGEIEWSYDALHRLEQSMTHFDAAFRLSLGLGYLGIGRNGDAVRVLNATLQACNRVSCPMDLRTKLSIFSNLARTFLDRSIQAQMHPVTADQTLKELLRPVEVSPEKLHGGGGAKPSVPTSDSRVRKDVQSH